MQLRRLKRTAAPILVAFGIVRHGVASGVRTPIAAILHMRAVTRRSGAVWIMLDASRSEAAAFPKLAEALRNWAHMSARAAFTAK